MAADTRTWRRAAGTILGAAAMGFAATAREYYVDAAAGMDTASGTSPAEAWQSLARVSRAELRPGDTVRFRRGGQWRGTLAPRSGSEAGPVTYTAYGEGEKPLLLGSASRSRPEDWEEVAAGIWATRAAEYTDGRVVADCRDAEWSRHQEAGADVEVTREPAEGGSIYRLACRSSGTASNHIQFWGPFPDASALAPGGCLTFRFRARSTIPFRLGALTVRRGGTPWTAYASSGEGLLVGSSWQDCAVRLNVTGAGEQPRLHLYLGGVLPSGAVVEFQALDVVETLCSQPIPLSVDVGNVILDHGQACGWKRWAFEELAKPLDYWYDPATWRVFVRLDANPAERYSSLELALRQHIVNQGGAHHVVYDGLALRYGAAHGFGGGATHHLVIRNCDLAYIGGGHQFTRPDGKPVRFGNGIEFWGAAHDNLVEGCRLWEIYDAALTNQGRGPESKQINITYRNNIVWNCEYSFEYWNNPESAETRNVLFENNTCVHAGRVWSHAQRPDRNGSHLMFYTNTAKSSGIVIRHNIFCHSSEWGSRFSAGWDPLPEIDRNLWFQPDGTLCWFFREKLPAADVEGYRRRTGFDLHSGFADPGFVDVEAGDFRLRPDSPARRVRADGGMVGAASLWGGEVR
ncbi:MAG: hypothetical protein JXR77_12830 [Lentisphaeria bacterium]|nr:hypothetical protein [Lentisphaeria bacterium]